MNALNANQNLLTKSQRRREREGRLLVHVTHAAPQFGQVLAEQRHHAVVEALVAPAADEATHALTRALQLLEDRDLHLEHLLLLIGGLDFQSHQLLTREIQTLEDLAEAASAQTPDHAPTLLDHVTSGQETGLRRIQMSVHLAVT